MTDLARVASATDVSKRILAPVMDCQVANRQQQRLIDSPETPEPDSIAEHAVMAMQSLEMLLHLARTAGLSNRVEGELERSVTGYVDEAVATMRDLERNQARGAISGRKLAGDLIVALNDNSPWAYAELSRIFEQTPASRLFAETTTYTLGAKRTARLRELHGEWKARHEGQAA